MNFNKMFVSLILKYLQSLDILCRHKKSKKKYIKND